jgi:hypothetical protein
MFNTKSITQLLVSATCIETNVHDYNVAHLLGAAEIACLDSQDIAVMAVAALDVQGVSTPAEIADAVNSAAAIVEGTLTRRYG